jgi:hypothetical protein
MLCVLWRVWKTRNTNPLGTVRGNVRGRRGSENAKHETQRLWPRCSQRRLTLHLRCRRHSSRRAGGRSIARAGSSEEGWVREDRRRQFRSDHSAFLPQFGLRFRLSARAGLITAIRLRLQWLSFWIWQRREDARFASRAIFQGICLTFV